MNATELQLLRNAVQDAYVVRDLEWWMTLLMAVGAVSLICLFVAGFLYLVTKDEIEEIDRRIDAANERVLRDLCTCHLSPKCSIHSAEYFKRNHVAALSIAEMKNEGEGR